MPTIQFKGKNLIANHHLSVPYHSLQDIEEFGFQAEKGTGNLIVEGDNLIALKALLPQFSGKVKCIYIDPPYNTGNEGWIYSDKVNSILIKEWIGKTVGIDDLTRHDKWLCMMMPRLKILRELLNEEGIIFISIDFRESHYLKFLLDEIFSRDNLVAEFIWHKKYGGGGDNKNVVTEHETVYCYSKTKNPSFEQVIKGIEYDFDDFAGYDMDEEGRYYSANESILMRGPNSTPEKRPNLCYPIIDPDGNEILPRFGRGTWSYELSTLEKKLENNDLLWKQVRGQWMLYKKQYLFLEEDEVRDKKPRTVLDKRYSIGQTGEGTNRLKFLFDDQRVFPNPKPVSLLKFLINLATETNTNDIVLDSFAGSGTTFDAVMELNTEDGGNRKCILVQMTEATEQEPDKNICRDITRERNKLAIEKFGYESGFKYLRVGNAIDPETMLEGELPTYSQFAEYVFYLATGGHLAEKDNINAENHFVGTLESQAIYLIYEQDFDKLTRLALTLDIAEKIIQHSPGKRRTIFAPSCFLDEDYMSEKQIEFVSVPYNLFERKTAE